MIRIKAQDAEHQYDGDNRKITTWDKKKCSWIVNKEFENDDIDWYGEDSDFPAGSTLRDFLRNNPKWSEMPDILVIWTYASKEDAMEQFGDGAEYKDWYDKQTYPCQVNRSWGYIDEPKKTAAKRFKNYCGWDQHASDIKVYYNNELIHHELNQTNQVSK